MKECKKHCLAAGNALRRNLERGGVDGASLRLVGSGVVVTPISDIMFDYEEETWSQYCVRGER